jgi:hypothetical protein
MKSSLSYPTGGEYLDALFSPAHCFADPALRGGTVLMDARGMPKPISGNFATVFRLTAADSHRWAVKCFTRDVPDQQERYGRISASLNYANATWRVPFEYLEDGILCAGKRYPVLKMEWIEATGLIPYIENHLNQPAALALLAQEFARLAQDLSLRGMAHGDLQHGNLLVASDGSLRLIDYDGMYVPGLEQLGASEIGHANYQSPHRTIHDWGPALDRFSEWVIYCSLLALSIDPSLWRLLHRDGDEALLLTRADYDSPAGSAGLRDLATSNDPRLVAIGLKLREIADLAPEKVPPFDPADLPATCQPVSAGANASSAKGPVDAGAGSTTPDWIAALNSSMPVSVAPLGDPSWILGHLPQVERVSFRTVPVALVRIVLIAAFLTIAALAVLSATKRIPVLDADLGVPLIPAAWALTVVALLRRSPEWRERRGLGVELRKLQRSAATARSQLTKAEAFRRKVNKRESEALGKIDKLAGKARDDEQSEISRIDRQLTQRLSKIDRELHALDRARDNEKSALLSSLQQAHISACLATATISGATIPGIGSTPSRTLQANGIRTAADFTGVGVINDQVYVRLASGRSVHPHGIGRMKAQALETWRQSLVTRARITQPTSLPQHHSIAIAGRYAAHRAALEGSARDAKNEAKTDRQLVQDRWKPLHADIASQTLQTRSTYAQYRSDADFAVITARRSLHSATWLEAASKHRLSAYSGVKYSAYLARSIRG